MKQPFWISNLALLFIFFIVLWFVFFMRVKVTARRSIEPDYNLDVEKKETRKIDISTIYQNDLFNTLQPEVKPIETPETSNQMPSAPEPLITMAPENPEPQFLEPLPLTLTGIIVNTDETKNIAIIQDNRSSKQNNYKVNDEIEDAQIIRIFKNKVILVRSNGQQEILFVRQADIKDENKKIPLNQIVKKITENVYQIDPIKFANYVNNLGEFIESLDLITAYKQGVMVGSRIGKLEPDSLGIAMGLMPGDIIKSINGILADNTNNRYEIFKNISSLDENDDVNVEISRNDNSINLTYKIKKITLKKPRYEMNEETKQNEIVSQKIISPQEEKEKILQEKYKFAPTLKEIRLREKQNMLKQKNLLQQSVINE